MVRLILYISLIVSISLTAFYSHKSNVAEAKYYNVLGYKKASVENLLFNLSYDFVFFVKPRYKKSYQGYKVIDFVSEFTYKIARTEEDQNTLTVDENLMLLSEGKLALPDTLNIEYSQIKDIIDNANSYAGFRPNTSMLHIMDDFIKYDFDITTIFWMLGNALLLFFISELIIQVFKKRNWPHNRFLFQLVFVFFASAYVAITPFLLLEKSIVLERALIYFISSSHLIMSYILFELLLVWLNFKERIDLETVKFILLLVILYITPYASEFISGIFLRNKSFDFDSFEVFNALLGQNFEQAITISLAFGIFNLVKHWYESRGNSELLKIAEERALKSEAELSSIQSSVNPHFLYNSLNSIATLTKTDPSKTEKMTLALSSFYKYVTNREGHVFSTITKEIEMIETYLDIEKIRFEDRLNFELDIQGNLKNQEIPNFLLQPLVENAIKNGYNKSTDTIDIKIQITGESNKLCVNIYDKGRPFDESLSKGYGLRSVTKKLQLLYPNRHELNFENNPKRVGIILKKESND